MIDGGNLRVFPSTVPWFVKEIDDKLVYLYLCGILDEMLAGYGGEVAA